MKNRTLAWTLFMLVITAATLYFHTHHQPRESKPADNSLILLSPPDENQNALVYLDAANGYQGLAVYEFAPDDRPQVGEIYPVDFNGEMTRSQPPKIIGQVGTLFEAQTAVLNLPFKDIHTLLAYDSDVQILDVRTEEEYNSGHWPDAILLPLSEIRLGHHDGLDRSKPLYVYCRSGNRSTQAIEILQKEGFPLLVNLGGLELD
ncbi:MAG: rhodanese-like domain-containing protein [Eubacteriales bacterium]|nr:rhodanese-like domain-containing protein [Eubacteriales bacterium]